VIPREGVERKTIRVDDSRVCEPCDPERGS